MTTANTFFVDEIIREPQTGSEDNLVLTPGVNVLVGPPNTGKTKWLQMLNFLLTSEEEPADVFGEIVAAKYTSVLARLTVAGDQIDVERRWDNNSPRNRVVVNGDPTTVKDFLGSLFTRLHIPSLHYPQGDPYGKRTWPELGWKSLYRHMYRRQLLWSDIADKQPESEQHACILQFTGIAERLFSDEYGQLVEKQKK